MGRQRLVVNASFTPPPSVVLLEPLLLHDKSDAKFRGRFSCAERKRERLLTGGDRRVCVCAKEWQAFF